MRLPAEWEPHERTLMAWPCREGLWGETMAQARADYAAVASAIAAFEPVTMVVGGSADAARARAACASGVEVVELPLDDSWLRDCGPIYVRGEDGARLAVHFGFNGWGKYTPYDKDAAVGRVIAEMLGDEVITAPIVLEGGSIQSDGRGTLITTEECLLHENRNPTLSREQIEAVLRRHLGVSEIVWMPYGLVEDRDTDGHVDLVAAYLAPGRVMIQTAPKDNPNHERCEENRARLRAAGIEVLEMPFLPYTVIAGETVATGYMNFYICNAAVIVPLSGAPTDADALSIIAGAFPEREVVGVPGAVLAYGGGGPHCITQQVPLRDA
jgi:agmatine deiminase